MFQLFVTFNMVYIVMGRFVRPIDYLAVTGLSNTNNTYELLTEILLIHGNTDNYVSSGQTTDGNPFNTIVSSRDTL